MPFDGKSKYFSGGRRKESKWVAHLCEQETEANVRKLKEIRDSDESSDADKIKAIGMMLDRAHGKPHQSVDIANDGPDLLILTETQATSVLLEEFGDRGALPPHTDDAEMNDDGDGDTGAS